VQASAPKKKFRPGDLAPITGIYLVTHGSRHRDRHEVVIIRGEHLPTCRSCKLDVWYEIVRPISHITHDWDFSGPYNLAVRPKPGDFQDFRMFRRAHLQLPIKLRLGAASNGGIIHGQSSDLSAGGVGAVIRSSLPARYKTETVKISIERGQDSLQVFARLRYQNGFRHGFEFMNVGETEREAIRRFIGKRRTRAAALTD
jgi:hypothetical protein